MATTSRGRQRGTIKQRGQGWEVRVYAGLDPVTGQRRYMYGTKPTEAEAKRLRNKLVADIDAGKVSTTRVTVRQAIDSWLKTLEIEESTRHGYEGYVRRNIQPVLGSTDLSKVTVRVLEEYYAHLRRCRDLCDGKPRIDHRPDPSPPADGLRHDCQVSNCRAHECKPLAASTVKQIHAILSGTFDAAVRWEWMNANPARIAKKPKLQAPDPQPPTAEQAAKLISAAWDQDEEWGMLVWLVMVTGVRRAELCALRREHIDFNTKILTVRRNYLVRKGKKIEKDTKTHQRRHISLDDETVEMLQDHWGHVQEQARKFGVAVGDQAYLFSYSPDHSEPCSPDGVSHRYEAMAQKLGIDTHIHALRHFSATELVSSGVDIRTVAGRLGHGGGGTTTLRVYTAWVPESDRRAAETLVSRFGGPRRRKSPDAEPVDVEVADE